MAKQVEIFRVIRYVGTPEFISFHMTKRSIKGRVPMGANYANCFIEEAFLGETPIEVEENTDGD